MAKSLDWVGDLDWVEIGSSVAEMFTSSYHTGGIAWSGEGGSMSVSPALFAGAPRFHGGLMPDEFPAILQKGEGVAWANESLGGWSEYYNP